MFSQVSPSTRLASVWIYSFHTRFLLVSFEPYQAHGNQRSFRQSFLIMYKSLKEHQTLHYLSQYPNYSTKINSLVDIQANLCTISQYLVKAMYDYTNQIQWRIQNSIYINRGCVTPTQVISRIPYGSEALIKISNNYILRNKNYIWIVMFRVSSCLAEIVSIYVYLFLCQLKKS